MPVPELVPLETLKNVLRLPLDLHTEDETLDLMLTQATALVLDYVNARADDGIDWAATIAAWDEESVLPQVQAAILRQAADLYRFRGDDSPADDARRESGYLPAGVRNLLYLLRDPGF